MQCDQSSGDCWCVDQLGLELTGTRMHGNPDCGKEHAASSQGHVCGAGLQAEGVDAAWRFLTGLSLVFPTDDIVGFSGDFGSGVGWEDEEEKETEEAGEEAEEEEGEAGEADDGGYIW